MPTTPSWRADCHAVLNLAFFNIYRLVSAATRNTYNFQILCLYRSVHSGSFFSSSDFE
jgi:hypothetical protein